MGLTGKRILQSLGPYTPCLISRKMNLPTSFRQNRHFSICVIYIQSTMCSQQSFPFSASRLILAHRNHRPSYLYLVRFVKRFCVLPTQYPQYRHTTIEGKPGSLHRSCAESTRRWWLILTMLCDSCCICSKAANASPTSGFLEITGILIERREVPISMDI